jgi:DNA-binding transcriptional ArsR family regulator
MCYKVIMTLSTIATAHSSPDELPPPLPEPAVEDLRLDVIMAALADPLRLTIIRKLLLESEAYDHTCGWFGFDRPKSSLTHHFKALRGAGLIRQRQYGLERRSRVRTEDLDARFPGLLDLVRAWRPEYSS